MFTSASHSSAPFDTGWRLPQTYFVKTQRPCLSWFARMMHMSTVLRLAEVFSWGFGLHHLLVSPLWLKKVSAGFKLELFTCWFFLEEEFRAYTEFIVPDVPRQSGCSNAVSLCLCERFPPGWAGTFSHPRKPRQFCRECELWRVGSIAAFPLCSSQTDRRPVFSSSCSFTHLKLLVFVVHTVLILTLWNLEPF